MLSNETMKGAEDSERYTRAIEQAAIAEQAAPAGEAVAELLSIDPLTGVAKVQLAHVTNGYLLPRIGTRFYTGTQPAECKRCAESEDTQQQALLREEYIGQLQAKVAELTAERDGLILAVADHVTASGEQVSRISSLRERLKAYQQAWDAKDLHKQLSQLVFKEAHGVEFEHAHKLMELQIAALTTDKARAEAVIDLAKKINNLPPAMIIYRSNGLLAAIADYQKGVKS